MRLQSKMFYPVHKVVWTDRNRISPRGVSGALYATKRHSLLYIMNLYEEDILNVEVPIFPYFIIGLV